MYSIAELYDNDNPTSAYKEYFCNDLYPRLLSIMKKRNFVGFLTHTSVSGKAEVSIEPLEGGMRVSLQYPKNKSTIDLTKSSGGYGVKGISSLTRYQLQVLCEASQYFVRTYY